MRTVIALCLLLFCGGLFADDDESFLYWSKCKNALAVDGDTIDCKTVALGFKIALRDERFRFALINAPESRGRNKEPAGVLAKQWLGNLVNGKDLYVRTVPDKSGESDKGSFGRWLGLFYLTIDDAINDRSLNAALVAAGHAVYKKY